MATARKRSPKAAVYSCYYQDEHGVQRQEKGYADHRASLDKARKLEDECRKVRDGLTTPGERSWREAAKIPIAVHVAAYRKHMEDNRRTAKHCREVSSRLVRLFVRGKVKGVGDLAGGKVEAALVAMCDRETPQKANKAIVAVKQFTRWLDATDRISRPPKALMALRPYPTRPIRVRRALTAAELERLLTAAEQGAPFAMFASKERKEVVASITGPERAWVYRLVMATGFRANEVRTLTPERFDLGTDRPSVTVLSAFSKRGKRSGRDDVQPIRSNVVAGILAGLEGKPPGRPVVTLPIRTAKMLRVDLEAAGIPYEDDKGRFLDFHALRASFITACVRAKMSPKVVQTLARHSTITLTFDIYTKLDDDEIRKELEES